MTKIQPEENSFVAKQLELTIHQNPKKSVSLFNEQRLFSQEKANCLNYQKKISVNSIKSSPADTEREDIASPIQINSQNAQYTSNCLERGTSNKMQSSPNNIGKRVFEYLNSLKSAKKSIKNSYDRRSLVDYLRSNYPLEIDSETL